MTVSLCLSYNNQAIFTCYEGMAHQGNISINNNLFNQRTNSHIFSPETSPLYQPQSFTEQPCQFRHIFWAQIHGPQWWPSSIWLRLMPKPKLLQLRPMPMLSNSKYHHHIPNRTLWPKINCKRKVVCLYLLLLVYFYNTLLYCSSKMAPVAVKTFCG